MEITDSSFKRHLVEALANLQLEATEDQLQKLCGHYEAMVETNRSFNLTRIIEPKEAAIKHYADSLSILLWADRKGTKIKRVLDVGTGAGFPAIPLAIMRPNWSVTAIDSTRKKIDFVSNTAASLELTNLHTAHVHSEHWKASDDHIKVAQGFDLVLFRALGPMFKAINYAAKFVAAKRYVVAYATQSLSMTGQDLHEINRWRLKQVDRCDYTLQHDGQTLERSLIVFCEK